MNALVDYYYKKMYDARQAYRLNHSPENYASFKIAQQNYHAILEGIG